MRNLSNEEILQNLYGAVNTKITDGKISVYRYSDDALKFYSQWDTPRGESVNSVGIRFDIYTDSEYFEMNCECFGKNGVPSFFDVYTDEKLILHKDKDKDEKINIRLELKSGKKRITVYFPYTHRAEICNVKIDDDKSIYPVLKDKKALFFGDSITQGFAAGFPSLTMFARVSQMLDLDSVNQGISGETFNYLHIDEKLCFDPDIIFAAYGTNDWNADLDIKEKAESFFKKLKETYPNKRVFVLLPVWRKPDDKEHKITFEEARKKICDTVSVYENMTVIDTMDFIPHYLDFYADGLHPNDLGMEFYANGIYKELKYK